VLSIAQIIKFVMASAAESELAALFITTHEMIPHRQTLIDMGWPGDTANILARKWYPAMLFLLSSSINHSHCPSIIVKVHHSLLMFALPLLEQLPADHMGSTAMDE